MLHWGGVHQPDLCDASGTYKQSRENVNLTNSGTAAIGITSLGFTGTGAREFSQTNNCGSRVAAGASARLV